MITFEICGKLFKRTAMCVSTYSKISALPMHNLFARNYVVLSCNYVPKICTYKCNTWNTRSFTVNKEEDKTQSFQYKLILLRRSLESQNLKLKIFLEIIDSIESNNYDISHSLGEMLLKCCGKVIYDASLKTRQELVDRVWNLLEKKKCKLTIDHYHALLCAYIDNDCAININEFLQNMTVEPQYTTYCLLLKILSNVGDYETIETYMMKMNEKGMFPTEEVYAALIYAHAMNGNVEKVKEIVNIMEKQGMHPLSTTKAQLIFAFAKNGNLDGLITILKSTTIPTSDIMKVMKFLSLSKNGTHISKVLKLMQPLEKSEISITTTIEQLVHAGCSVDAYTIATGIPISTDSENMRKAFLLCLVKNMIFSNIDPQILLKIVADIAIEHNMNEIWKKAIEFALEAKNRALALMALTEMKAKNVIVEAHYYYPLLLNVCKSGGENDIFAIIKYIAALGINIDSTTLMHYVFPHINVSDPIVTVQKLKCNGLQPICVVEPFMIFLLNEHRVQESLNLCSAYNKHVNCQNMLTPLILNYKVTKDISHCLKLLFELSCNGCGFAGTFAKKFVDHIYFEQSDVENFTLLLNTMKSNKAFMSEGDVQYVIQKISNMHLDEHDEEHISSLLFNLIASKGINHYNSGKFVHPAYMNIDQLNLHLYELKSTGKNTRGILRRLLMFACKTDNVEHVNQLVEEIQSSNLKWTPGMIISLFSFYTRMEEVDKALYKLNEMQSQFPSFKIDGFKILQFVRLLLQRDEIEKAFEILSKDICINHKIDGSKECLKVLNVLANSRHFNYTEKMINLLVQKDYCTKSTSVLRWLVMVPLMRNDIESAVNIFKRCFKKYNKTPGKQELLKELVEQTLEPSQSYNQLLQDVYRIVEEVHGRETAVINLAVSLALCGKINELKNLFQVIHCCLSSFNYNK